MVPNHQPGIVLHIQTLCSPHLSLGNRHPKPSETEFSLGHAAFLQLRLVRRVGQGATHSHRGANAWTDHVQ